MGFSLEYPSISLHAISRDPSAYPQDHLYVMVNGKQSGEIIWLTEADYILCLFCILPWLTYSVFHSHTRPLVLTDDNEAEMQEPAQEEENGDDDSDSDSATVVTEIRFVPSDKTACE